MRIFLRRPARCGGWCLRCRSGTANLGRRRCGLSAAALSKETAIAIPLTLAAMELVGGDSSASAGAQAAAGARRRGWRAACCRWRRGTAWHYAKTGFLFGNPEFLRYNAQATLDPLRMLAAFGHRILHLTAHMNMFVPVLMTHCGAAAGPEAGCGRTRAGHDRPQGAWGGSCALLAGECGAVQRVGRSAADALPAAHVSAGAAGGRDCVLPAGSLLAGAGGVFSGGVCAGTVCQSAVWVCAGRQPGLRARGAAAVGGDCAA